ncbi:MAG: DNA mismatch repair endonuclease MutL [Rikenellaceae bacterium]|nr:DNA mismatch repair endonuclease MutL [Rikenellaceae bacterium]
MADRIKLLPEVVANQIAAGEVVNRPSSVVKEMMENAIDAGASTVTVNFCDGGRDLIQIVDDGCGMSPTDARMAFDRHATSKIASVDDIYKLHTFGFRGEALASIAAVAQVELKTRQASDEFGTQVFINGGEFDKQKPCGCSVGSQFFVRNLFYNVPARRRFMEKSTTLARQIRDEFERVALCNPQIAFKLFNNQAPIYDLDRTNLRGRIVDVVGKSIKNNLLEVSAETSLVKIEGFVGRPAAAKKSSYKQFLFVNGRYFKSPYFYKAVMKAYEKLIPAQTQPDIFLYLIIDPDRIDVNVHPQKTEVKFSDGEAIWQIINAAVRETLAKTGAVPLMDFDDEGAIDIPVAGQSSGRLYSEPKAASVEGYNPFREGYASSVTAGRRSQADLSDFAGEYRAKPQREAYDLWPSDTLISAESEEFAIVDSGDNFRDLMSAQPQSTHEEFEFVESDNAVQQQMEVGGEAQFEDIITLPETLAAARYRGRLVVVDLRRACERVSFEEYETMLGGGSSVSQQLLFPERLVLSNDEVLLLKECLEDLSAIGFDLRVVDDCTVEMSGTPADMEGVEIDRLIYDVIHSIADGDSPVAVRRQRLAAMVAQRRAAAMRGVIGVEQTEVLLARLAKCENVSFAPSGKAIMVEISTGEIRSRLG